MTAIEILAKEHDSILQIIRITEVILKHDDGVTVNINHVESIIDFIKNFADKYHHLKEEDVLFKEMENYGMSAKDGPIAVMLNEHDEGRNYIKLAVEGIEKFKQGDVVAFKQIKNNLLNYCTLLTNHIAKENNVLYPMAEKLLPVSVKEDMEEKFEKTNSTSVNDEYFNKYLKLVDDLSVTYL